MYQAPENCPRPTKKLVTALIYTQINHNSNPTNAVSWKAIKFTDTLKLFNYFL